MSYRDRLIQALTGVEEAVRQLLQEAVTAQAYRDVALIASTADSLAALSRNLRSEYAEVPTVDAMERPFEPVQPTPAALRSPARTVARSARAASHAGSKKGAYPRFLRDEDRLVKVAWSKKERRPYEHRAPKSVIHFLLDAVRTKKGEGKLFEAAAVLPLHTGSGEEIPSYQSYLALSWLRHAGVVTRMGRTGYVVRPGTASPEKIERLWSMLALAE